MIIEEQARPFDHHAQTFAGLESIMAPNLRYDWFRKTFFLLIILSRVHIASTFEKKLKSDELRMKRRLRPWTRTGQSQNPRLGHVTAQPAGLLPDTAALGHSDRHNGLLAGPLQGGRHRPQELLPIRPATSGLPHCRENFSSPSDLHLHPRTRPSPSRALQNRRPNDRHSRCVIAEGPLHAR